MAFLNIFSKLLKFYFSGHLTTKKPVVAKCISLKQDLQQLSLLTRLIMFAGKTFTAEEQALSLKIMKIWTDFAKTGYEFILN